MNYIEKALRTESIEGAVDRLHNVFNVLDTLNFNLVYTVEEQADALKKYIFYGKIPKTINISGHKLPDMPTTDIPESTIRLLHAGLGMLTEAQEFLKPIIDNILHGTPLDIVNLKEELGDMMWYEAIGCNTLGTTFEEEQERNIAKLTRRYPDKFTSDKAIYRDIDAERQILEDN